MNQNPNPRNNITIQLVPDQLDLNNVFSNGFAVNSNMHYNVSPTANDIINLVNNAFNLATINMNNMNANNPNNNNMVVHFYNNNINEDNKDMSNNNFNRNEVNINYNFDNNNNYKTKPDTNKLGTTGKFDEFFTTENKNYYIKTKKKLFLRFNKRKPNIDLIFRVYNG